MRASPHLVVLLALGCEPTRSPSMPDATTGDRRALPAPDRECGPAVFGVIARRRSVRDLDGAVLGDAALAQLLWAAQGVTGDGLRAAPSAGALYPLTVYVAEAAGLWRYVAADHALVRERPDDRRAALAAAGRDQSALRRAPAIVVITGREAITAEKYGARAPRYVALEAGHAAHGLLLAAAALDLSAVPIGAFDDDAVRDALVVARDVTPLYLIPVGR